MQWKYSDARPLPAWLTVSDAAKEKIIDQGCDLEYGARPLKRAIEKLVEDPLSERMLRGQIPERSKVDMVASDDGLDFLIEEVPEPESETESDDGTDAEEVSTGSKDDTA
jgi:hypothetical protein